ncbi:MAG: hypothetical protein LBT59_09660 [Clostridiales bacterium]|nr:hypothetical protein [Clostridiales bacterium]
MYERNESWRIKDANGLYSRQASGTPELGEPTGRYGLLCPNSGYRSYVKSQLNHLASNYEFEGVFIDMAFWPKVCYCESCRSRWEAGEMPRIVDWNDGRWNAFQHKRERWLHEFEVFCTDVLKKANPALTVSHQCSSVSRNWVLAASEDYVDACDYAAGDFYEGPTEQGIICKLFNSLTGSFEFMTSRCVNLRDHTTKKPLELIKLQAFIALAHKGAFLHIDAIDPSGEIDIQAYEDLGAVLKEFELYEKYLGGELIADVAILFDSNSKMDFRENGMDVTNVGWVPFPHIRQVAATARVLKERHIPFTVIAAKNLKNASYKAIVLTGVSRLSEESAEDIREYVRNGGAVYASGDCARLEDVLGFKHLSKFEHDTYISPELGIPIFSKDRPMQAGIQSKVEALPSAKVLASIMLPITDPGDFTKFASIHSNPPGKRTEYPAVIANEYGKGRTLWMAGSIESMGEKEQSDAFVKAIAYLTGGSYSHFLEAPPVAEAICFDAGDYILASILNVQPTLPAVALHGARLSVDLKGRSVRKALLLPEEKELPFEVKDGYARIELPPINLLAMVIIRVSEQ